VRDLKRAYGKSTRLPMVGIAIAVLTLATPHRDAAAGEVVFLKDGQTIQADKTEVIGDRVRSQRPTGEIELPRSSILSIHELTSPGSGATSPPPAKVYPGLTQDMNERVRQEIQQGKAPSRP